MIPFAVFFVCATGIAQAGTPASTTTAAASDSNVKIAQKDNSKKVDNNKNDALPSAALLEYLDQYGGAADGSDPLELATDEDTAPRDTSGKGP